MASLINYVGAVAVSLLIVAVVVVADLKSRRGR
jgi:hypothetical protein